MAKNELFLPHREYRGRQPVLFHEGGPQVVQQQVTVEKLVADHHRVVFAYAYRLTGNQADAEDVAQQAFLTAHRNIDQLRQPDRPVPWLLTIARNCWLKSVRRKRPTAAGAVELDVNEVAQAIPAEGNLDGEQLQFALDKLADEFRLPLVMFYFEELSYKEIATELDLPPGTVMSRLSRAKNHLRKLLLQTDPELAEQFADEDSSDSKLTSASPE